MNTILAIYNSLPYILLLVVILSGFIINLMSMLLSKYITKKQRFFYNKTPLIRPKPIPTKDKGFFGAIWLWLSCTREWILEENFEFALDGVRYHVPKGYVFDGASIPKMFRIWLSPTGVLMIGSLVHDYLYQHRRLEGEYPLKVDSRNDADKLFRDICIDINGLDALNYMVYYMLVLFGWYSWNKFS